jgi:biopolymer transport protein TolR
MPKVLAQETTNGRGQRGRRTSSALAEINVIPLVDVMLVLLIIFMVTAPMLQRGIEVNLPVATRSETVASERTFVDVPLSYKQDRRVFIGKEPVRLSLLAERMRQLTANRVDKQVYVRAEGQLAIQDLVDVFDTLKAAGISTAGLVTETPRIR